MMEALSAFQSVGDVAVAGLILTTQELASRELEGGLVRAQRGTSWPWRIVDPRLDDV